MIVRSIISPLSRYTLRPSHILALRPYDVIRLRIFDYRRASGPPYVQRVISVLLHFLIRNNHCDFPTVSPFLFTSVLVSSAWYRFSDSLLRRNRPDRNRTAPACRVLLDNSRICPVPRRPGNVTYTFPHSKPASSRRFLWARWYAASAPRIGFFAIRVVRQ